MTENEVEQKTVSLPSFSGKKKDYSIWWKRFTAYATIKKFDPALVDGFELPDDPENIKGTDEEKAALKKNVVMNNLAVACLTMALQTEEDLEYLDDSATVMYENGVAYEVANSLRKTHRPDDRLFAVEAETEMRRVKLNSTNDPDDYFKKVAVVKSKYKNSKVFDESTLIANVMDNVPECYEDTVAQELRRKGDKVTLDDLKGALKLKWRISTKGDKNENTETVEGETALSVNDVPICDRCGKKGHRAAECWTKMTRDQFNGKKPMYKRRGNKKGGRRFKGKCNLCGKVGHKEKDCWTKASNASKKTVQLEKRCNHRSCKCRG